MSLFVLNKLKSLPISRTAKREQFDTRLCFRTASRSKRSILPSRVEQDKPSQAEACRWAAEEKPSRAGVDSNEWKCSFAQSGTPNVNHNDHEREKRCFKSYLTWWKLQRRIYKDSFVRRKDETSSSRSSLPFRSVPTASPLPSPRIRIQISARQRSASAFGGLVRVLLRKEDKTGDIVCLPVTSRSSLSFILILTNQH